MYKALQQRPLVLPELKGKVDIKWFGHAGFKITFKDAEDKLRSVYVDIWIDNKDCPKEDVDNPPNDVDVALVTHA